MGSQSENPKKIAAVLQDPQSASRRDLLSGTVAAVACALVPASAIRFARTPSPSAGFSVTERQCLDAMVSRIIPSGPDGPGALEAGCAQYIESALGDAYQSLKKTYSSGLAALDNYAISIGGRTFAALATTEQDKLLSDFERNTRVGDYSDSAVFFEHVRQHTLEGMFGDPSYGGNANFAGWDLIGYPGLRMFVTPEMQKMDAEIPRSRVSAEQLMHGSY